MHRLLEQVVLAALGDPEPKQRHDSAVLEWPHEKLVFTTDAYTVSPRVFPGGDIGSLAVHGTVNDLAMSGAMPSALSVALVIEEGLEMSELWEILCSLRRAADECGVPIVTGDTKVVERSKADGLFVCTAGIGYKYNELNISPNHVVGGDAVIVSGDLARHGMAIMSVREGLEFESPILSDSAPLHHLVGPLLRAEIPLHCLRDVTRGGLASVLNEISSASGLGIEVDETAVPIDSTVLAACEILGLDPLYVACEGRFTAFVPQPFVDQALAVLHEAGATSATRIGVCSTSYAGVRLRTSFGVLRPLDLMAGEQLPRIC